MASIKKGINAFVVGGSGSFITSPFQSTCIHKVLRETALHVDDAIHAKPVTTVCNAAEGEISLRRAIVFALVNAARQGDRTQFAPNELCKVSRGQRLRGDPRIAPGFSATAQDLLLSAPEAANHLDPALVI